MRLVLGVCLVFWLLLNGADATANCRLFEMFVSQGSAKISHELPLLIVGAGPAGIAMARQCDLQNIPYIHVEAFGELGGNWNLSNPRSAAYQTLVFNSSSGLSAFSDMRFPKEAGKFLTVHQGMDYLLRYANQFGLRDQIGFGKRVTESREFPDGTKEVVISNGNSTETVKVRDIVGAAGAQRKPRVPSFWNPSSSYPFDVMFAGDVKNPEEVFKGKNIVVVGGGNTGNDLAYQAALHGNSAFWSIRKGYHFVPRTLFGIPADEIGKPNILTKHFPLWLDRLIFNPLLWLTVGLNPEKKYGVPKPDHKLLESPPISGLDALKASRDGSLRIVGDVRSMNDDGIEFSALKEYPLDSRLNGWQKRLAEEIILRDDEIDIVVIATGYEFDLPYIPQQRLSIVDGKPELFLNMINPQWEGTFFIGGHLETLSGGWPVYEDQAKLIAAYVLARDRGAPAAEDFWRRVQMRDAPDLRNGLYVQGQHGTNTYGVDYTRYQEYLRKLVAELNDSQP